MDLLSSFGAIPLDYFALKTLFPNYKSVRDKIASMEEGGKLIRLKRGLYVVAPSISGKSLSTELIANHIYGPSYVSMESALKYYGLIPEGVYTFKSMTTKRSRTFDNVLARFDYTYCNEAYYATGVKQIQESEYSFLIASPEKALCDLIAYTPYLRPRFMKSLHIFLEEDLRLGMDEFYKMDANVFRACAEVSKKKNDINNLIKLLEQ